MVTYVVTQHCLLLGLRLRAKQANQNPDPHCTYVGRRTLLTFWRPMMAETQFNTSRKKIKLSTFDQKKNADWGSAAEKQEAEAVLQKMESAYKTLISCVGKDDSVRSSLEKTPLRAAKALCYFTKGYEEDVASQS